MNSENKKKVYEIVLKLLTNIEALRDNDERLVSNVILLFLKSQKIEPQKITGFDLLKLYSENTIPTVDYITRIRRKIQNLNPELRGETYDERQKHSIKIAKQQDKKPIYEIF